MSNTSVVGTDASIIGSTAGMERAAAMNAGSRRIARRSSSHGGTLSARHQLSCSPGNVAKPM